MVETIFGGFMKYIGAHVSAAGGVENAPANASKIGAKTFALFTKNQRQWKAKELTEKSICLFKDNCKKFGFSPENILPHDSYLINLGHPDKKLLEKSRSAFLDEMRRCQILGLTKLNFHPGSTLGRIDEKQCLEKIADSINIAIEKTSNVCAVLENTAGQGNNLGFLFEQIAYIIEKVANKNRIGVCLDTCHAFAAGYDIKTRDGFAKTLSDFDRVIGFKYLMGMHINDSKKDLGKRVDRHHNLGKGFIGLQTFKWIMQDRRFDEIPLILETPDDALWEKEIRMLYSL